MSCAMSGASQVVTDRPFGWGGAPEALSSQHLDNIGALLARKSGGTCGAGNRQRLLDEGAEGDAMARGVLHAYGPGEEEVIGAGGHHDGQLTAVGPSQSFTGDSLRCDCSSKEGGGQMSHA